MKIGILFGTLATASAFTTRSTHPTPSVSWQQQQQHQHATQLWASTMDDVDKKKSAQDEDDYYDDDDDFDDNDDKPLSFRERVTNSGVASAAAMATAAVNAAVSMKTLEAPDNAKSYISLDKSQKEIDEEGLPLVYDKDLIQAYWSKERGALNQRWGYFVSKYIASIVSTHSTVKIKH